MTKKPCNDCPFRPRTFTPLVSDDVTVMLDEVMGRQASFSMYCHKDFLYQDVECKGAILFKQGDQTGVVFKNEAALVRAHARSHRKPEFHWNHDDDIEEDA